MLTIIFQKSADGKGSGFILALHGHILRMCNDLRLLSKDKLEKVFSETDEKAKQQLFGLLGYAEHSEQKHSEIKKNHLKNSKDYVRNDSAENGTYANCEIY